MGLEPHGDGGAFVGIPVLGHHGISLCGWWRERGRGGELEVHSVNHTRHACLLPCPTYLRIWAVIGHWNSSLMRPRTMTGLGCCMAVLLSLSSFLPWLRSRSSALDDGRLGCPLWCGWMRWVSARPAHKGGEEGGRQKRGAAACPPSRSPSQRGRRRARAASGVGGLGGVKWSGGGRHKIGEVVEARGTWMSRQSVEALPPQAPAGGAISPPAKWCRARVLEWWVCTRRERRKRGVEHRSNPQLPTKTRGMRDGRRRHSRLMSGYLSETGERPKCDPPPPNTQTKPTHLAMPAASFFSFPRLYASPPLRPMLGRFECWGFRSSPHHADNC